MALSEPRRTEPIPPTLEGMRRQRLRRQRRERIEARLDAERRRRPYDWRRDGF